jgi:hypothetical protein
MYRMPWGGREGVWVYLRAVSCAEKEDEARGWVETVVLWSRRVDSVRMLLLLL